MACYRAGPQMVRWLIKEGRADTSVRSRCFGCLYHVLTSPRGEKAEKRRVLFEHGADTNAPIGMGSIPPLHLLCSQSCRHDEECFTILQTLIVAGGADVNLKDSRGHTCLFKACSARNVGIVRLLVSRHQRKCNALHPLCEVIIQNKKLSDDYKSLVHYLLEKGADTESKDSSKDSSKRTALH